MATLPRILIVEDSKYNKRLLNEEFTKSGYKHLCKWISSPEEMATALEKEKWDIVITSNDIAGFDAFASLKLFKKYNLDIPFVVISNNVETTPEIMKAGAYNVICRKCIGILVTTIKHELKELQLRQACRETEQLLQKERDKAQYYLDVADVMIVAVDENQHVTAINKKGCDILECKKEEIIGKNWFDIFVPSRYRELSRQNFLKFIQNETGPAEYFENPVLTKKGEERSVAWSNTLLEKEEGELKVVLSSGKDITEDKIMEQQRETFIATLTHDLNTPIRAESQVLELLLTETFGSLTDEQKKILTEIHHSNQFMQSMVDSLLTIYKYEAKQVKLHMESMDLNRLINLALSQQEIKTLIEEKELKLKLCLAKNLSPIFVDSHEIQRVLSNLIRNATFFSPEGADIAISTSTQNCEVRVTIEDSGRGIEPEMMRTLFDRYSSIAKKFRKVGTGLSLYLSRQIIEEHGGHIWAESEVGKGSKFYFALPIHGDL